MVFTEPGTKPGACHTREVHSPRFSASVVGGAPVRGMADACLAAIGVETSAEAVARHYGARANGGLIDAWLVDESDAAVVATVEAAGIRCVAVPAMMTDVEASARLAGRCLDVAAQIRLSR